ncbi:hypothetical protein AYO44_00850 [Planctomycetaceae bacterium SCGC AG-212-F19]|nr:hypothetical protein AYO44_00850 [Planctomycetaceae bacterium SCGC AG-212-F19]
MTMASAVRETPLLVHDEWLLTAHRAAVHVPTATAVIADLHLGYNRVRRRIGEAVPTSDPAELIHGIRLLCQQEGIRRLVIAGDLCEDGRDPGPLGELFAALAPQTIEMLGIIPGNHDRQLAKTSTGLPLLPDGLKLGRWHIMHGDAPRARGYVVQGHVHPCLRWAGVAAPCFLVGPRRLILPAFSTDAAGGNVLRRREWLTYRCAVIAGGKVLDFGPIAGLRQRLSVQDGKRKRGP